ncbi:MAG: choice-of-anchor tandem repeat GloVer-containing protein, partial [Candidatus Sulfotelmatobacter sp.]
MQNRDISFPKIALLAIFASTLLLATRGVSQTETVLHSFDGKYGYSPDAGLIFDSSGNLYGSTYQGGAFNYGMIFELVPGADSHWAEKVVRNCNNNGKEGYSPDSSLIFDPAGNLYGTTDYGGAHNAGTVFELARKTGGGWIEKVLHSFSSTGTDGYAPEGGLVFDAAGNLYGTTNYGGTDHSYGTVFELTPSAGGGWAEHVLFSFDGATSGEYPVGGLVLDAGGNLYGVAAAGGSSNYGTVFELTPHSGGIWSEKTVLTFTGANGVSPSGSLTFDAAGNLYGTTGAGGTPGAGTVFKLTPADGGGWSETILYNFLGNSEGAYPA